MAEAPGLRSRSARPEEQSTARRQTGALHAAGVDHGRLVTERGRQDHAGQHIGTRVVQHSVRQSGFL